MSKKWTEKDIPDQSGRIAIVTGSNTGLGYYTAQYLADKGAEVIMACRSLDKANEARDKIKVTVPGAKLEVMKLDLSSQKSVKDFVVNFQEKYNKLDLLINNAGVMMCPFQRTEDGYELQMGTNHFGHFTLTGLLLPLLNSTSGSRVVALSSMAARMGKLEFDDLNWEKRKYDTVAAYGQTKLANLVFARELQRRLEKAGSKVKSLAAHPGWTATDLQRHTPIFRFLNTFIAMPTAQGSLPTLRAATDPEAKGGEYYGPHGFMGMRGYPVFVDPTKERNGQALNWEDAKRFFDISEEITGIKYKF